MNAELFDKVLDFINTRLPNCEIPSFTYDEKWLLFPNHTQQFIFKGYTLAYKNMPFYLGYLRCFETDEDFFFIDCTETIKDDDLNYKIEVIRSRVVPDSIDKWIQLNPWPKGGAEHKFFDKCNIQHYAAKDNAYYFNKYLVIPSFSTKEDTWWQKFVGYQKIWIEDDRIKKKFTGELGFYPIGMDMENIFIVPDFQSAVTIHLITGCTGIVGFTEKNCLKLGEIFAKKRVFQRHFVVQDFSPKVDGLATNWNKKKRVKTYS